MPDSGSINDSWFTHTATAIISAVAVGGLWVWRQYLQTRAQNRKDEQQADFEAERNERSLQKESNATTISEYERFVKLKDDEEKRWKAEYERIFKLQQEANEKLQAQVARLNRQHNECVAEGIRRDAHSRMQDEKIAILEKRLAEMEALLGQRVVVTATPEHMTPADVPDGVP